MRRNVILLIIVILLILFWFFLERREREHHPNRLFVSGNVEVTNVQVSFKIPGRVEKRFVDEGMLVQDNDLVALLESRELKEELARTQAEVDATSASLLELVNGYLPEEIEQARARLLQADADLKKVSVDFGRQKTLLEREIISQKEFDASLDAYEVANARLQEATANLDLLMRGVREEKIAYAEAKLRQAKEAYAISTTRLSYANLRSPLKGFVLSKNIEEGEVVAAGTPIVTVGNLEDAWLRAYVDEPDLGRIQLGQKVDVKTDTYPGKIYSGTITFISSEAEFTPKNVQTEKERVKLVYRIKISLDNRSLELKPGMPADGYIHLDSARL